MDKPTYLKQRALEKLPSGQFVRFTVVKDMAGRERAAVIWFNREPKPWGPSKQAFDANTGEYLGEAL